MGVGGGPVGNSVQGEGTRARSLGWDESLYEDGAHGESDTSDRAAGSAGDGGGHRRGGSRRRRRGSGDGEGRSRKKRILRWTAITLAVLILGTAAAGYLYVRHLDSNLRGGNRSNNEGPPKPEANAAGQTPLNILLIGSDSRNEKENLALGGSKESVGSKPLADVQKLLHVSADRKHASVVSIPRDTRVNIPECSDAKTGEKFPKTNGIINKALGRGGPSCVLDTWQQLTGIYIDHWMMIDFSGVVKMSDAVGGVDVCLKQGVWDRSKPGVRGGSHLKLPAGTQKIQGEDALKWLRTRHAFESDKGRAKAQHMYMNSMLRELKSQNAFTDTGRLTDLAEAATKALSVSDEIKSVTKLFNLAMQLKDVPSDSITMTSLPTVQDPQDANHYVVAEKDAAKVLTMIRDDIPFDKNGDKNDGKGDGKQAKKPAGPKPKAPMTAPGELAVTVQNGTGTDAKGPVKGRASDIAGVLTGKGYARATANREPPATEHTTVTFPSAELEGDAQAVAKALGIPDSAVKKSSAASGVTVVVGSDWRTGNAFPKAAAPTAGDVPDSAEAVTGNDTKACMDVYAPYRWNGKD
ncbi:LCP family protein [Streptomyces sp. NPDC004111]|uniref:LCP family protein n=1 Tax=Streptomyces sp. NPDC004111 TaxID=3364690 RepID=UPI0036AB5B9D